MGKGSEGNPAPTMDTTAVATATDGAPVMRVAIAGAGFSGAILARQLRRETGVEVVCYEKMAQSVVRKHWTQPVTGAGLNLNPNSLACLRQVDPELESMIRGIGLPRRSVTALTVTGRALYQQDVMAEGLSDAQGCRVRWDDANTLIRREAGDCMRWETTVDGHTVDAAGKVTVTLGHADGSTSTEGDFDLLVAGEGRYSPVRTRVTGTPPTTYGDVCNFRILVPNAQPDGSPWPADCPSGLFDDLQLVYNDTPTVENLAPDSTLRQDPLFTDVVMRSTPRVGIMRIPASKFKKEVGESLYIFGNFAIPAGGDIPASSKTGEAMHCMFTPAGGDEALTPEGRFIRETLARNADKLHWSRFQDIPVEFADQSGHVLMLGDAAHAFCPSLGQGASTSIEDACLAGTELRLAVRKARASGAPRSAVASSVPTAVAQIASRQAERVAFIRDMSTEAGEHIRFGKADRDGVNCLAEDVAAWTDDEHASGWRDKVRRMWLGYPKLEPLH
jgi:2-polyprenyl-6-methoxyphenol hydroxylase-like FAD-dependent oxidoreductase